MADKLVLQYSRSLKDGGRATGQIVLMGDDDRVTSVLHKFQREEFRQMLYDYAKIVGSMPDVSCCFQRTDRPGFPVTEWAPAHIQQMRADPEGTVNELSEVRQVTYDMRKKEEE